MKNKKLKKLKNIWDSIISMSSLMINRRPNCKLYYVCTGKWLDDKNLNAIKKRGQKELDNLNLFESLYNYLSEDELLDFLVELREPSVYANNRKGFIIGALKKKFEQIFEEKNILKK